jgi:hypothetical protein
VSVRGFYFGVCGTPGRVSAGLLDPGVQIGVSWTHFLTFADICWSIMGKPMDGFSGSPGPRDAFSGSPGPKGAFRLYFWVYWTQGYDPGPRGPILNSFGIAICIAILHLKYACLLDPCIVSLGLLDPRDGFSGSTGPKGAFCGSPGSWNALCVFWTRRGFQQVY